MLLLDDYWLTADSCAVRACVLAIADFMINPARAGTQTHMALMDLLRLPPCWFSEPRAAITTKATATRANRFMGLTSVMDTKAGSWEFPQILQRVLKKWLASEGRDLSG